MSKLLLLALLLLTSCSFVEKLESVGETAQEVGEIAGAILPPPWGTIIGGVITGTGGIMIAAAKIRSRYKILDDQKQIIETTLDSVINGVESGNKEVKKSIQNEARKRNVSDVLEKYVVKNKKT